MIQTIFHLLYKYGTCWIYDILNKHKNDTIVLSSTMLNQSKSTTGNDKSTPAPAITT